MRVKVKQKSDIQYIQNNSTMVHDATLLIAFAGCLWSGLNYSQL